MGEPKMHIGGNRTWNCFGSRILFFLIFSVIPVPCLADSNDCDGLFDTPGRTWPKGDIVLEYGKSLRIYCMLNENLTNPKFQGRNSSDLVFFRNDLLVEPEYITVANHSAIMMYVDQPTPSADTYYCKLRMKSHGGDIEQYEPVCLNNVTIGFKPQEPLNFSCVSDNWEKLVCTWKPAPNYIATRLSLTYKFPGQDSKKSIFSCPDSPTKSNLPTNTCFWDKSTHPPYRQDSEFYIFEFEAENVLGTNTFSFIFNHWAHVIPSKPVGLQVVKKTSSAALLEWSLPFPMKNFPPGLRHRIRWRNERYFPENWVTEEWADHGDFIDNYSVAQKSMDYEDPRFSFILTRLHPPNAVYIVRVSMRSAAAVSEASWGEFSEITFKTAPDLPGSPPKTDISSFEIVGNSDLRDVYIYWRPVPEYLENGDNFTYRISRIEEENARSLNLQPDEITKTYAKFRGMSLNSLTFDIVSTNCEGPSEGKATIRVPSQSEMPQKPVVFTRIVFNERINELSWNPLTDSEITNYTIFWCIDDLDHPFQCSGSLIWIYVPGNARTHNVTASDPERNYKFAIALNTAKASSGMVWFSDMTYSSQAERNTRSFKSVHVIRVDTDVIEIDWELHPYLNPTHIIQGFRIHYCQILSPDNSTCKGPRTTTTLEGGPDMTHCVLPSLNLSTSYMFIVAVLSKDTEILHSDELYYFPTLQAVQESHSESTAFANSTSGPASAPLPKNVVTKILFLFFFFLICQ